VKLIEDNQCVIITCKETGDFSDDTRVKVQLRYLYVWIRLVFFMIDKLLIVSVLDRVWCALSAVRWPSYNRLRYNYARFNTLGI